jgi:hypothetical protein
MGDVDRRKHDVDVIERVLGGVGGETGSGDRSTTGPGDQSTPLLDIDVPWFGGSMHSTVELTVGLPEESRHWPSRDDLADHTRRGSS